MATSIANPTPTATTILPSYLYKEYADDDTLQAFVDAYNQLAQGYLDWFNLTPLAVYTSPNVNGALLDWIGQGLYGISRPVFSSLNTDVNTTAVNNFAINTMGVNSSTHSSSGTAILATDDYYKRTLTWYLYIGNSRHTNATNIRLRVARFLFGINGTDVTLSQAQAVSVTVATGPVHYVITVPAGTASEYFSEAFSTGTLAFPFQLAATVVVL